MFLSTFFTNYLLILIFQTFKLLNFKFQSFKLSNLSKYSLTLSWRRPLSYRYQSIDLLRKSMNWFQYDNGLHHERVKRRVAFISSETLVSFSWSLENNHFYNEPTLMKTPCYDSVKCLSIKKTQFQQHDLVLKLFNKMCYF